MRKSTGAALAAAGVLVGLAVGAGGDAMAVGEDTAIHACVQQSTGALRVLASGTCKRGENLLTWNQAGPAGPAGPAGAIGPAGTDGSAVLWWRSAATYHFMGPGADYLVPCPAGYYAISGGYTISGAGRNDVNINSSQYDVVTSGITAWRFSFESDVPGLVFGPDSVTLELFANCLGGLTLGDN